MQKGCGNFVLIKNTNTDAQNTESITIIKTYNFFSFIDVKH